MITNQLIKSLTNEQRKEVFEKLQFAKAVRGLMRRYKLVDEDIRHTFDIENVDGFIGGWYDYTPKDRQRLNEYEVNVSER